MPSNRGATSLKCRRRARNPMTEYDRLPSELRHWMASALRPWRAGSVRSAYDKAMARTGDAELALRELDRMQMNLVAKDARKVWGEAHPQADRAKST